MLRANLNSGRMDRLLRPFSRLGLSPNGWSLLALAAALGGFVSLTAHELALGLVFFVVSGFLDVVDGAVARATKMSSSLGAFIDGVLDRYVELLLILGLAVYLGGGTFLSLSVQVWMILLLFGSLMTSFVRAYADHRGVVKNPDQLKSMGGLLERAERLVLLYTGMALGLHDQAWLLSLVALTALLANATAVQRIVFAVNRAREGA